MPKVATTANHSKPNASKIAAVIGHEHLQLSFTSENVDLIVDSDCIAWLVLNNKSKSVNIVNYLFIEDFKKVCVQSVQF